MAKFTPEQMEHAAAQPDRDGDTSVYVSVEVIDMYKGGEYNVLERKGL